MALLTRYETFVAGPLSDEDLNGIQDLLVDLFDGTDTATHIIHQYQSSDAPNLTLDNTGSGPPQRWQVAGVLKAAVTATGQFQSLIATGTAPFVVTSTTPVANLKAATTTLADNTSALGASAASLYALKTYADVKTKTWTLSWALTNLNIQGVGAGTWNGIERRRTTIVPVTDNTRTAERISIAQYTGALGPGTAGTIDVKHFDSSGTLQNTWTVTLPGFQPSGELAVTDISPDVLLEEGDYFRLDENSPNGASNIILVLEGSEIVQ